MLLHYDVDSVIEVIDGRMMISLESISDVFGYKVSYDKNIKEISISLK